jgi:hypothetical protein
MLPAMISPATSSCTAGFSCIFPVSCLHSGHPFVPATAGPLQTGPGLQLLMPDNLRQEHSAQFLPPDELWQIRRHD